MVVEDERTAGEFLEWRAVMPLRARFGRDALPVKSRIDRVRVRVPWMKPRPDREETPVILAAAEGARTVSGGESRSLVEEEELGKAPGLHQRMPMPASKREPAGDPALAVVAAANAALVVVQATPVAVDETACRVGDDLAQRCDSVL